MKHTMKHTKRILAVLLAAVMAFGALALTSFADSIYDTAKAIPSGKTQTASGVGYNDNVDYKFTAAKAGTLTISATAGMSHAYLYLYDSDGNTINCDECKMTSGTYSQKSDSIYFTWNRATEKIKFTATYTVSKGTYYIRLCNDWDKGDGKVELKATYPTSSSSSAKISCLSLEMEVGDSVKLGAVLNPADSDDDVTWKSSKKSVATVSSTGKITAKKTGTATITATCGTSKVKIKVVVK